MPRSRSPSEVAVSGIGLAMERAEHPLWQSFLAEGAGRRDRGRISSGRDGVAISSKERRLLSEEDLLGIAAAELARIDAKLTSASLAVATGCIVATTGKHTVRRERSHYRLAFERAGHTLDGAALAAAIETGEAQVSPFALLEGLDNNVLWWICKEHKIATINLQLVQTMAPGFYAVWEAVELIREGTCRRVIVGGYQSGDQAAVHGTLIRAERPAREDPTDFAGAAIFFVLERADALSDRDVEPYGFIDVYHEGMVDRGRATELLCDVASQLPDVEIATASLAPAMQGLGGLFKAAAEQKAVALCARAAVPAHGLAFLPRHEAT
jgi:3-oxoacyl-(acyl-carrier-protein) synthase